MIEKYTTYMTHVTPTSQQTKNIMSFARIWTGFSAQAMRGNSENINGDNGSGNHWVTFVLNYDSNNYFPR